MTIHRNLSSRWLLSFAALCVALIATATPVSALPTEDPPPAAGPEPFAGSPVPIELVVGDTYVVEFAPSVVSADEARNILESFDLTIDGIEFYKDYRLGLVEITASTDLAFQTDPRIVEVRETASASLEPVEPVSQFSQRPAGHWALDSLDGAVDGAYNAEFNGKGVHVYVVDTGAWKNASYAERIGDGFDAVNDDNNPYDCKEGDHGSNVSETLAGTITGSANGAIVHNVAIFTCRGDGKEQDEFEGLRWIEENLELPAVINTSFGAGVGPELLMFEPVMLRLIDRGVTVVTSAGNNGKPFGCFNRSPSRLPGVLTVGGMEQAEGGTFQWWRPSSYGRCVLTSAPVNIPSGWLGTSFSSPYVAGLAAQVLEDNPRLRPNEVAAQIAVDGVADVLNVPDNTVNARALVHKSTAKQAPKIAVKTSKSEVGYYRAQVELYARDFVGSRYEIFLDGNPLISETFRNSRRKVHSFEGIVGGEHILAIRVDGIEVFNSVLYTPSFANDENIVGAVSCLAGNGRVDLTIRNEDRSKRRYQINFQGLTPRTLNVKGGDYRRTSITGRPDGRYKLTITVDGKFVLVKEIIVDCDSGSYANTPLWPEPNPSQSPFADPDVATTTACRNGQRLALFHFVNPTAKPRRYRIVFEFVPDRWVVVAPHGSAVRQVRPPTFDNPILDAFSFSIYENNQLIGGYYMPFPRCEQYSR